MENFFEALKALGDENSVETELLIEKVKSAMLKAAKRTYPHSEDRIRVVIDPAEKKFAMYIAQEIIDDEPIDENEINIETARTIDPNAVLGGTIMKEIDVSTLGRMAALSAKQSIKGDLREINRNQMLNKFEQKEHDCIVARVSQIESGRGTVTVVYEGTELYLFKNEQIPGETFRIDQPVKVYITDIAGKTKKPIVKISRTHKDLVKRLFELEVPEIYDGTVEVKSISREAGSRTKIAVWSKDPNVDAVGACIGARRSRITAVVNELHGEKIDIIPWSESPEEFVAKALSPAETLKTIVTSYEEKTCTVVVPNNQLSLAIGIKGQNAKLAAKLTGYKIDIKPQINPITGETAPELEMESVPRVKETEPEELIDNIPDSVSEDGTAEIPAEENTVEAPETEIPAEENTVEAPESEIPADETAVETLESEFPVEEITEASVEE